MKYWFDRRAIAVLAVIAVGLFTYGFYEACPLSLDYRKDLAHQRKLEKLEGAFAEFTEGDCFVAHINPAGERTEWTSAQEFYQHAREGNRKAQDMIENLILFSERAGTSRPLVRMRTEYSFWEDSK